MLTDTPGYYGPGVGRSPVLEKLLVAACAYPHDNVFNGGHLIGYMCEEGREAIGHSRGVCQPTSNWRYYGRSD